MDDRRLDLTPLDPFRDAERFERMVRSIVSRAAPELERRAEADPSLFALLAAWARPMLAAAAVLLAVSGTLFSLVDRVSAGASTGVYAGLIDVLGVPAPAADWLREDREPVLEELLLLAQEGDERP